MNFWSESKSKNKGDCLKDLKDRTLSIPVGNILIRDIFKANPYQTSGKDEIILKNNSEEFT